MIASATVNSSKLFDFGYLGGKDVVGSVCRFTRRSLDAVLPGHRISPHALSDLLRVLRVFDRAIWKLKRPDFISGNVQDLKSDVLGEREL